VKIEYAEVTSKPCYEQRIYTMGIVSRNIIVQILAKQFTFGCLASIFLFVGATLAINVQTAQAQPSPLPGSESRTGGSAISSSAPAFWFRRYCASCHGVDGTGDGPVAASLRTKPADLTVLSKNNGGVFPDQDVHDYLDGTKPLLAHGSQQMPVWGYPTTLAPGTLRGTFKPEFTRTEIETRIKLIVGYVKSIQKK